MELLSVNTGKAMPIAAKSGKSGIFKLPQAGPVAIGPLGLEGDTIVDTANHGGHDQAVYLYGQPDYEWWSNELDRQLQPGTFGENLTLSGMQSGTIRAGDRFAIGDVLLEVTFPRIPCVTLGVRMSDPGFVKRFHRARRPGVCTRVLQTGTVEAGMNVSYISAGVEAPLAISMM